MSTPTTSYPALARLIEILPSPQAKSRSAAARDSTPLEDFSQALCLGLSKHLHPFHPWKKKFWMVDKQSLRPMLDSSTNQVSTSPHSRICDRPKSLLMPCKSSTVCPCTIDMRIVESVIELPT